MADLGEIAAARRKLERALRWQTCLTVAWMWFALFFDRHESVLVIAALFGTAGLTLASGRYVLRCPKDRLNVAHQVYALLCTVFGFSVLVLVGMPSMKAITKRGLPQNTVTNQALLATLLSTALVCVSVSATTCAIGYSETVQPLKAE